MMQQIYYDFIKHFMCFSEFSEQLFYLFEFSSAGITSPQGRECPKGGSDRYFPAGGALPRDITPWLPN
ncbi:hypothetical protein PVAP13_4NG251233 [Panicum virgatum]|uniref:Uncharacterized protein n=1 Tax=Panicum virgatum TaxID=38727 RepID=A0A8T0T709_PANVG|nr:hypothetical protein PVAP13_4NG251233 [Panicum virgatum]KAG2607522.1 hypothetical protein PVAP13_4NG251233 [Panicum virgatum]